MRCSRARAAISSRLDGEDPGVDAGVLDAHVAGCPGCRSFAGDAARLTRAVRVAPAPPVPDLTPDILAAVAAERDAGREPSTDRALRWVLAAVGLLQIAVAIPALVLGDDANLPVHLARHLGSFDFALGVGFLFAAWRPQRAAGILPLVAALVVCLVGSSLLDVVSGATAAGPEVHHATDVAGLVLVWLISRTAAARGDARRTTVQLA
jgi:predicted anti-sigma-YlaC factor YlaD